MMQDAKSPTGTDETANALRQKGCLYVGQTADGVNYWEHKQARRFHAGDMVPAVWADTRRHLATAEELDGTGVCHIVALPSVIADYRSRDILPKESPVEDTAVNESSLHVVRLYDGFDNQWIDVSEPVSIKEANRIWNEKTNKGTEKTAYGDIDYYKVFPADTKMVYSDGFGASDAEPEAGTDTLKEQTRDLVTEFALRLNEFTLEERLIILVPMIMAQVSTSPDSVREWSRVLSLMLDKNPDQVVILCSNLAAKVALKHNVMPPLERIVDVAEGLEAHVLAGLERVARAAD